METVIKFPAGEPLMLIRTWLPGGAFPATDNVGTRTTVFGAGDAIVGAVGAGNAIVTVTCFVDVLFARSVAVMVTVALPLGTTSGLNANR